MLAKFQIQTPNIRAISFLEYLHMISLAKGEREEAKDYKIIPNCISCSSWNSVFREDCWNITLLPLPRTPGKSQGKQIREKAFEMLHQVCWGPFEQYPIPLAIQWNGNKKVGMQCWPTEGHSKISSPNAHCKVPLLTHLQLKKAHFQDRELK